MKNEALLSDVIQNPYDDAPRLRYAEWLEERGDPRGEFIRIQVELSSNDGVARKRRARLHLRENDLLDQHEEDWAADVAPLVESYRFDRGFVSGATISTEVFLEKPGEILDLAPIVYISLNGVRDHLDELFSSPYLTRIRALSLSNNDLHDEDIARLTESPHLHQLWWLGLSFNQITMAGVKYLVEGWQSGYLENLGFVSLKDNPTDPREDYYVEGNFISYRYLPEEGKALEEEYGRIPWLHIVGNRTSDEPPSPFREPIVP